MPFRFNKEQTRKLSDFASSLSLFFFATVVAPVFTGVDKIDPAVVVLGGGLAIGFFLESLFLLKG